MKWPAAAVVLCVSLGSASFAQANRTQRFALKYLSAVEVEQLLLPSLVPAAIEAGGGLSPKAKPGVLPAGIVAFAADPQTASLAATGTPDALNQLQKIIRLLDIPRRRINWSITAITQDDKLRAAAALPELDNLEAERIVRDAETRGLLQYRSELAGANSQPVRLLTRNGVDDRGFISLQARVNGDQTITLLLQGSDSKLSLARRVPSNSSVLLAPKGDTALLVRVQLLPPPHLD